MAALQEREAKADRLVLGKGSQTSIGTLIALIIFGAMVLWGLSSVFEGPNDLVGLLTLLIFAVIIFGTMLSAARGTQVIVDASQRMASRTETLLFVSLRRQELHFNGIRTVRVGWMGLPTMRRDEGLPLWKVELQTTGDTPLIINQQGTHTEMSALAQKVAALINRPVADDLDEPAPAVAERVESTSVYTPTGLLSSLMENLVEFAESAQQSPASPPIVAQSPYATPSGSFPRGARAEDRSQTARAKTPRREIKSERVSASAVESIAPAALIGTASFSAVSAVAPTESSLVYSAPPFMGMPQMPSLFTLAPALDVPTLPPLGGSQLTAQVTPIPKVEEIKQVDATNARTLPPTLSELQRAAESDRADARAQYRLARSSHALRALNDARTAYDRALRIDPANAAVHNDVGVLYYQQGNFQSAERALRRAVALDPFAAASRYNLGLLLARTRRPGEAYEQFMIGEQNAYPADASRFEQALRGVLSDPMLSPEP